MIDWLTLPVTMILSYESPHQGGLVEAGIGVVVVVVEVMSSWFLQRDEAGAVPEDDVSCCTPMSGL